MTNNDLNDNFKSTLLIDNQIVKHTNSVLKQGDISENVQTLFIVHPNEMGDNTNQTLNSIAQACQLTMDKYAIVPASFAWNSVRDWTQLKNIVLFGNIESCLSLNIQLPIHYIFTFDERTWIKTVNMMQLSQDKAAKTALWNTALKKHFLP